VLGVGGALGCGEGAMDREAATGAAAGAAPGNGSNMVLPAARRTITSAYH